jgi:hypothetical protein
MPPASPTPIPANSSAPAAQTQPALPSLLQQILLGWLRHFLTAVASIAVTEGWFTSDQTTTLISAVIILLMFAWSALEKFLVAGKWGKVVSGFLSSVGALQVLVLCFCLLAFAGCASVGVKWSAFWASPATKSAEQKALQFLGDEILSIGASEVQSLLSSGKVSTAAAGAGALNGSAAFLRSTEGTSASDWSTISGAVATGSGNAQVAAVIGPVVASAVTTAIEQGAAPDAAKEQAAVSLDTLAATVAK